MFNIEVRMELMWVGGRKIPHIDATHAMFRNAVMRYFGASSRAFRTLP